MQFFSRLSPFRAIRDLRLFLHSRQRHELAFFALALVLTALLIGGFAHDSQVERPYKREIIYVQSWPESRTVAEVRAQQAKDAPAELARKAEIERVLEERRQAFKRLDDKMERWGL